MIKHTKLLLAVLLLTLWSCSSHQFHGQRTLASSAGVPTFGAELTFTSEALKEAGRKAGSHVVNSEASEQAQEELIERILAVCDGCGVEWMEDKYGLEFGRIHYPDGHYINITLDPWVVEVTASPIPLDKLDEITARLNKDLYRSATDIGLHPSYTAGGEHIHFGVEGLFGSDPKLFRDFLVDLYNHPELASGILAGDSYNSPPMVALPKKNQKAFQKIIREFDESPTSINHLAQRIYDEVYSTSVSGWDPPQKYQGVNISRLVEDFDPSEETIEIRFIRPQQNADQFKRVAKLFTERVQFLKKERAAGRAVSLQANPFPKGISSTTYHQDKFKRFLSFVTESGLDPVDYLHLIGDEFTPTAWTYLEKKYPGNSPEKLTFLEGLARDSAYDKPAKAKFLLTELAKFKNLKPEHEKVLALLIERSSDSPEIVKKINALLSEHEVWSKSGLAKIKLANPTPENFRNSCLNFIKRLLVPLPQAR